MAKEKSFVNDSFFGTRQTGVSHMSRTNTIDLSDYATPHFPVMRGVAVLATFGRAIKADGQNPHYHEFRGKPTVLITAGEHYGAVMNLDFDYIA